MPPRPFAAWLNGLAGVVIFSGSLPATRLALTGFDPFFLTYARAAIAGAVAAVLLLALRERRPARADLWPLIVTSLGVVLGFPLLTAFALQEITASRSLLYIALLPVSTACFAVMRAGERPRLTFWLFSLAASALVGLYALTSGNLAGSVKGDLAMLAAVIVCGLGYAEGARLSRHLGGWQVICWALVIALPAMAPLAAFTLPGRWDAIPVPAIAALGYVSLFSMLIGFVFWYRGLAQGGIARIGQLQFLQPFMGLALSAVLLGETIGWKLVAVMALVIVCVAGARRHA